MTGYCSSVLTEVSSRSCSWAMSTDPAFILRNKTGTNRFIDCTGKKINTTEALVRLASSAFSWLRPSWSSLSSQIDEPAALSEFLTDNTLGFTFRRIR